jgi:hypothetical protein
MPSAAGIIIATGAMTLANEFLQSQNPPDPKAPVASQVNFRVIPATAIAAGLFYILEQASAPIAKGLAGIVFLTAFAFPAESWYMPVGQTKTPHLSPLGTLMQVSGISNPNGWVDSGLPIN